MRKVFLGIIFVVVFCGNVFAQSVEIEGNRIDTYVLVNTGGTYISTVVPITSIIPGRDRVIGFSIQGRDGSSENVIAVFDGTNVYSSNECLGEAESITNSFNGIWYPYPRLIENGVVVRQGPNTIAIIYFVRG